MSDPRLKDSLDKSSGVSKSPDNDLKLQSIVDSTDSDVEKSCDVLTSSPLGGTDDATVSLVNSNMISEIKGVNVQGMIPNPDHTSSCLPVSPNKSGQKKSADKDLALMDSVANAEKSNKDIEKNDPNFKSSQKNKNTLEELVCNRYDHTNQGPYYVYIQSNISHRSSIHPLIVGRDLHKQNVKEIKEIKSLGYFKVLVILKTKEAANQLVVDQPLKNNNMICFIPNNRIFGQGIVRNISVEMESEEIKMGIECPTEVTSIRRLNRRISSTNDEGYTVSRKNSSQNRSSDLCSPIRSDSPSAADNEIDGLADRLGTLTIQASTSQVEAMESTKGSHRKETSPSVGRSFRGPPPIHWWNPDCEKIFQERKQALRIFRKFCTYDNYTALRQKETLAKKIFKNAKLNAWRKYYDEIDPGTAPGKLWKTIKYLKNRNLFAIEDNFNSKQKMKELEKIIRFSLCPDYCSLYITFDDAEFSSEEFLLTR